jgi:hypothetical protein
LTHQKVIDFVASFKENIRNAQNEEEVRIGFHYAAAHILGYNDLKCERDRQDLRRNRIIIEFKDKGLFNGSKKSAKFLEASNQLINDYIPSQAKRDRRPVSDYIGICFDGIHFSFVFIEQNGVVHVTDLQLFSENSAGSLILALDKDERKELTAENVCDSFGPASPIAKIMINGLWNHFENCLKTKASRVEMLFAEWKDIFEQSTNLGEIGQERLETYLKSIGIPSESDLTKVLFILNTYHALFFKLLAAEIVLVNSVIPNLRSDYCFAAASLDNQALVRSLEHDIEESDIFRQSKIRNFVEGTFFSWYLYNIPDSLIDAIREILQHINLYRLNSLNIDKTRDVVKYIYQELIPSPLRHGLGEYFTPEWLVEFTLNNAGYNGSEILNKKYLDPCCGSGNFLIHAINRFKLVARTKGWNNEKILNGILERIYGFDLNPLAVLTARVNYLIAISDLIANHLEVEIPVYQADAVYSPSINITNKQELPVRSYQVGTNFPEMPNIDLELPEDLIQNNRLLALVLEIMEQSVRLGDTEEVYLTILKKEQSIIKEPSFDLWEPLIREMFRKIQELEKNDWNRIWCRIFRNFFASVAIGQCDIIAGNPPWVRWSELPKRYTERIKPTCDSYDIFSEDVYFGGNELDISGMITYTVADKWLKKGGYLCFVITQSHFQSQSSGGFRRFEINGLPLKVIRVDDFTEARPFHGLVNKPTILSIQKGFKTTYPVKYYLWKLKNKKTINEQFNWEAANLQLKSEEQEANPMGPGLRWSIMPPGGFSFVEKLVGKDNETIGRKGIVTDLNGAYFVEIIGPGKEKNRLICKNYPESGRQKSLPQRILDVNSDFVFPLIKGAENIRPFYATTSPVYVLIPNKKIKSKEIPTVSELAKIDPSLLRYFQEINSIKSNGIGLLDLRSTWRTRQKPQFEDLIKKGEIDSRDIPFYAIYDVGDYTFSQFKVVWAEISKTLQAAVISNAEVPGCGFKPIVPDHKVYFAPFDSAEEAHFICALLNSKPIKSFIDSFTVKLQVGTLFRHIKLPGYNPGLEFHDELVKLSKKAHSIMFQTKGSGSIEREQENIDLLVQKLIEAL